MFTIFREQWIAETTTGGGCGRRREPVSLIYSAKTLISHAQRVVTLKISKIKVCPNFHKNSCEFDYLICEMYGQPERKHSRIAEVVALTTKRSSSIPPRDNIGMSFMPYLPT
jgi:hypothetical protein